MLAPGEEDALAAVATADVPFKLALREPGTPPEEPVRHVPQLRALVSIKLRPGNSGGATAGEAPPPLAALPLPLQQDLAAAAAAGTDAVPFRNGLPVILLLHDSSKLGALCREDTAEAAAAGAAALAPAAAAASAGRCSACISLSLPNSSFLFSWSGFSPALLDSLGESPLPSAPLLLCGSCGLALDSGTCCCCQLRALLPLKLREHFAVPAAGLVFRKARPKSLLVGPFPFSTLLRQGMLQ